MIGVVVTQSSSVFCVRVIFDDSCHSVDKDKRIEYAAVIPVARKIINTAKELVGL